MNQERLAALIQSHEEALRAQPEDRTPHEAILSILRGLERNDITLRQALRLLSVQALRLDDTPAHQALYRQVAVALLQLGHGELPRVTALAAELHLAVRLPRCFCWIPSMQRDMQSVCGSGVRMLPMGDFE